MAEDTKEKVPYEDQKRAAELANKEVANTPGGTTRLSGEGGVDVLSANEHRAKLEREKVALEKKNVDLEAENRTNTLTGLPNERAYNEMLVGLDENWRRQREKGEAPAGTFIAADLTHLNKANDIYGETVGDDYLKKAGEIFRRHLRSEDRVFRLGTHSDTFVVHLSGFLSPEELLNVKDRINKSFEDAQREFREKYPDIDISVSMASTSYDANLSPMAAATDAENRISEAKREKRKLGFRGVQVDIPEKINV